MKKIIGIFLSIVAIFNLFGCNKKNQHSKYDIDSLALVTNTAGINDNSYNQLAWRGLQKAEKNLKFEVEYLESKEETDFKPNIQYFTDCALDMLFCVGYEMADDVRDMAESYPNEYYTIINYTFDEQLSNVLCIEFEDQEVAFIEGYLAANKTSTGRVGFIGGIKSGIMDAFEYGYRAGVMKAAKVLNKNISVQVEYIDNFYDIHKAKNVADDMYKNGVDIIFHAIGGAGVGVIESAKENNRYVIGSDMDQNFLAPENVLSSTIRHIDDVVYNVARKVKESPVNQVTGKSELLGIKDGAIGIALTTKNMVSDELMNKLEEIESKIKNSEIDPPYNEKTFKEYVNKIR